MDRTARGRGFPRRLLATTLLACAGWVHAGTSAGFFEVRVTLNPSGWIAPDVGGGKLDSPPTQVAAPTTAVRGHATASTICIGQANESVGSVATVSVVCSPGAYVTIRPLEAEAASALVTDESRFGFGPGKALPTSLTPGLAPRLMAGTVTALRISGLANVGPESALELLVSF